MAAAGSDLALWPSSKCACSSCMSWCFPILLRMLQHCFHDPWKAIGHILKEWWTFPSPFTATDSSDGSGWVRFGTLALFEVCLLLLYVLVLPNSSTHVATLFS